MKANIFSWVTVILTILALSASEPAKAQPPCDFMGLAVGSQLDAAKVMKTLGVRSFKTDPPQNIMKDHYDEVKKFGLMPASEIDDERIGPYCTDTACRVPAGLTVGNDGIPAQVFVGRRKGLVTEIDVAFAMQYWDEIKAIIDRKYGADWSEEIGPMVITDMETKASETMHRTTITHISNGKNAKTGDTCQIWASNLDIIQQHHDLLGAYHAEFVIKLISTNF